MIAIIDYDTGNTRNVQKAFQALGVETVLTSDKTVIEQAAGLVLPGVGAFPLAMQALESRGLVTLLKAEVAKGKPLLGVCLGTQLLLEGSREHNYTDGLGFIPGVCEELPTKLGFPVPHMGWNQLKIIQENALTQGLSEKFVYFVHSFYANCPSEFIYATAEYSVEVPAMIANGNVYGAQFHPEKSSTVGLGILKQFKEVVEHANSSRN
ncbi:MAG: imidazole glycerol phosphate synthase subunit HisH [Lactobacillales bacterium]|jgi:glutamine amidotransferase|nr:imidazole glycerol phosphate synthase subunit HisH [Lactobacillales bacterium]